MLKVCSGGSRYRQADRKCLVASASSTVVEAIEANMGTNASADFQPSKYSQLLQVCGRAL